MARPKNYQYLRAMILHRAYRDWVCPSLCAVGRLYDSHVRDEGGRRYAELDPDGRMDAFLKVAGTFKEGSSLSLTTDTTKEDKASARRRRTRKPYTFFAGLDLHFLQNANRGEEGAGGSPRGPYVLTDEAELLKAYEEGDEDEKALAKSAADNWSAEADPLIAWLTGPRFGQCCQPMARRDEEGRPTHIEVLLAQLVSNLSQSPFSDSWTASIELLDEAEQSSKAGLREAARRFLAESPCQPGDRKWDLELFFAEAACWPVAHACDTFVEELNGVAERFGYRHGALEFLRELGDGDERREERETAALEATSKAMEALASEVDTLCLWRGDTLDYPSVISRPNIRKGAGHRRDGARPADDELPYGEPGGGGAGVEGISPTFVLACVAKDLRGLCNLPTRDLLEFVATGSARRGVSRFFMVSESPTPSHPASLPDGEKGARLSARLSADAKDTASRRCDHLASCLLDAAAAALQGDGQHGARLPGNCQNSWKHSLGYALYQHALRIAGISKRGASASQRDGAVEPPPNRELMDFLKSIAPGIQKLDKHLRGFLLERYRKSPGPECFDSIRNAIIRQGLPGTANPAKEESLDRFVEALGDLSHICVGWPEDAPRAIEALLGDDDSLKRLLNSRPSEGAAKLNVRHRSRSTSTSSRPKTTMREVGEARDAQWRGMAAPRGEAWRWLGGRLVTDRYPEISPWLHAAWRFHDEEGRESQGQQGAEEGAIPKEVSELAVRYVRLLYRLCAEVETGVDVRMFTKTHRGGSGCVNWDEVVKQKRDYERFVGIIADCKRRFRIELGDEARGDPRLQVELRDSYLSLSEYAKRYGKKIEWVGEAQSIYNEAKRLSSTLGPAATPGTDKAGELLSSCRKVLALSTAFLLDLDDWMWSYAYLSYSLEEELGR